MSFGRIDSESLLSLVKAFIIDIWEVRKQKLYRDNSCPQSQSSAGDLGDIEEHVCGKLGQSGKFDGKLKVTSSSVSSCRCMVDDNNAMIAN